MNDEQVKELLLQALETETGGAQVYRTAIRCAANRDLEQEWSKYLGETERHQQIVRELFSELGLDPEEETPGRAVVREKGEALVKAMESALRHGTETLAQIVAAECVVDAEMKDHANWELIGRVAEATDGRRAGALRAAYERVEEEEDRHLYHTRGWARELWIEALGMEAVLPPPEEEKDVTTAIGAARAEKSRNDML